MFGTKFGQWEFHKSELITGLSDQHRQLFCAGLTLFLLVLGTGPAGYFEDWEEYPISQISLANCSYHKDTQVQIEKKGKK